MGNIYIISIKKLFSKTCDHITYYFNKLANASSMVFIQLWWAVYYLNARITIAIMFTLMCFKLELSFIECINVFITVYSYL